jgi:hypothetical protein
MPNKLIRRPTMDKLSNKAQRIGAELVVRAPEMQGVTHVSGLPGAKINAVFNALVDSTIETVVCRHEQKRVVSSASTNLRLCFLTSRPLSCTDAERDEPRQLSDLGYERAALLGVIPQTSV